MVSHAKKSPGIFRQCLRAAFVLFLLLYGLQAFAAGACWLLPMAGYVDGGTRYTLRRGLTKANWSPFWGWFAMAPSLGPALGPTMTLRIEHADGRLVERVFDSFDEVYREHPFLRR
jgi:hypothetical protein